MVDYWSPDSYEDDYYYGSYAKRKRRSDEEDESEDEDSSCYSRANADRIVVAEEHAAGDRVVAAMPRRGDVLARRERVGPDRVRVC